MFKKMTISAMPDLNVFVGATDVTCDEAIHVGLMKRVCSCKCASKLQMMTIVLRMMLILLITGKA